MLLFLLACNGNGPCKKRIPEALKTCINSYSAQIQTCYQRDGSNCSPNDPEQSKALEELDAVIFDTCSDQEFGNLSPSDLSARLQNACASESSSMGWRLYGGPQGSVWEGGSSEVRTCLDQAHTETISYVSESLHEINECLTGQCDPTELASDRQSKRERSLANIDSSCSNVEDWIAIDTTTYLKRLDRQIDCLTATSHPDTQGLDLSCGPSNAEFEVLRGEWQQVKVDGDKWGTMCGDGSPYAFQVKFAPEGEPLDKILIG